MPKIIISATIKALPNQVFESYINPEDNKRWNTAGDGWSTGTVNINPIVGGQSQVEFKSADGKSDFMFATTFTEIIKNQKISYKMSFPGLADRVADVTFEEIDMATKVTVIFDIEDTNSQERQREGWSNILESFKKYVERKYNPNNAIIIKEILINATPQQVWNTLWNQQSYKVWTNAFCAGSYYEGEMKYNERIKFLSPDGNGLSSVVRVCIPFWQISFEHLAAINKGIEDFDSPEFVGWKGAKETYTLTEVDGSTNLEIYQEVNVQKDDYFAKMWNVALENIKNLTQQ